jgi:diguanylate cyclase (GGDEF)-like protein/putative nucleotidyltransferase with HDIG domain/PAS domain S-box-containing protein
VRQFLLRAYVGAVFAAGVAVTAAALVASHDALVATLVFCVAAVGAEQLRVTVGEDNFSISLSLSIALAAAVAVGPEAAAAAGLCAGLAGSLFGRNRLPMIKRVFNGGLYAMACGIGGVTFQVAGGDLGNGHWNATDLLAAAACLLAYFAVAWPLLVGVIKISTGRAVTEIWDDLRWLPVQVAVSATLGFSMGIAYILFGWAGAAVYLAPLVAMREASRQYTSRVGRQMRELWLAHAEADEANRALTAANAELDSTNEGLLKTLAAVIDARDIYLYGHSVQASKYAGQVARKLGLSEREVRFAELGALLHDLGKIGVSEAILNKPARLTDEEYEEVKSHCDIGHQLLSNLPHFEEVADIVWSHHEEYDGTGYPRGIAGENIPIGARIVSVVEATEAMVSDRPYRKGMSPDEVLQELAAGAGSQWDPRVVEAFSGILSADRKHLVMRNSALDIELSRSPIAELAARAATTPDMGSPLAAMDSTFLEAVEPIFILDAGLRVVAVNAAAERATGWRESEVQGRSWLEVCADPEPVKASPQSFVNGTRQTRLRRADATDLPVELVAAQLQTNGVGYWMVLSMEAGTTTGEGDITVPTDVMTGMPTRAELERRARMAIRKRTRPLTVVVFDVEGLGAINRNFGHDTGDAAVTTVGSVLTSELRAGDIAVRVGGDRFAALMVEATLDDACRVVERVETALPMAAAGLDCVIEFSSGAAQWNGEEDFEQLLRRAETWLTAEKRGRGRKLPAATAAEA